MAFQVLLILLLGAAAGAATLYLPRLRRSPRISLRTLLIAIAVLALPLAYWTHWRYSDRAQVGWLQVDSPQAKQLLGEVEIAADADMPTAAYTANYVDVRRLYQQAESSVSPNSALQVDFDNDRVVVQCEDPLELRALLSAMQQADRRSPDQFVIRGIVINRDGLPIAGAAIDLIGPRTIENYFRTRADGSFSMPVNAPEGDGYALQIRADQNHPILTTPFSLDEMERERIARVRLPR
ncbi:carboxypeptidase-like regulatory domain-containing protein [Blastopirellula sp. JC732]|uniref:Carboxypeptidase-like regulatory domain-containing protein n=1 Tax=Blastopirellula sediminis TaxID=2894196 RepID=A0A9X1MPS7_9BACT|nr:carboxypeptidase-like regulatory domain-containing protein [Blastopirellula sediminis]MCC9606490.1 carboxypeptidase-like regulatory domain-containing protein [Blastopirellula sediminis]MCC9630212.1 carboxypeptidase-like regulatory domain-containing protein [Blastopirellula sediminis]